MMRYTYFSYINMSVVTFSLYYKYIFAMIVNKMSIFIFRHNKLPINITELIDSFRNNYSIIVLHILNFIGDYKFNIC